jgi:hypothetical protein
MMDVDEAEQRIKITYDDGVAELFAHPGFGDNAVQRVICNKLNVKMLGIILPGTGAVTELNFCPQCRALKKMHDNDNHCLRTGRDGGINGVEEIAFDDFEGSNSRQALKGWRNALWEQSAKSAFSQFIGRYGENTEDI